MKQKEKEILFGDSISSRHPIIPNSSIYDTLNMLSLMYRKSNAIDCLDLKITYEELINNTAIVARALKEIGIKQNDIITIAMPNYSQAVIMFLAANKVGAITSFLNSGCTTEEIKNYLNEFESPLFVNFNKEDKYNDDIIKTTKVKQIITLYPKNINSINFSTEKKTIGYSDKIDYNDLFNISEFYKSTTRTKTNGSNTALLLFTSGSTGNPKTVTLTNKNIVSSGIYMKNTGHIKMIKGEKCLTCIPFCYPYGFSTSTLMSLMCGREAILTPNLNEKNINYYLSKKPNYVFGSPAILDLILKNTNKELDLSSIHSYVSGGDFLTPTKAIDAIEFFKEHNADTEVYNGFGNAEGAGTFGQAVGSKVKRDSVGKILSGMSAIIIDPETEEVLDPMEEGLLYLSGKNIFKGYFKNEELTKESIIEYNNKKYFKTGVIGKLDEEGYFYITGRLSRFYIRMDSHKVYLEHLQKVLSYYDFIYESAAVQKPNEKDRYETKVYIVLKDNVKPTEELKQKILELLKYPVTTSTGEKIILKEYEIPKEIEFVDKIPKTKADKTDFKKLEQIAQKEYEKQYKKGERK